MPLKVRRRTRGSHQSRSQSARPDPIHRAACKAQAELAREALDLLAKQGH